MVIASAGNTEVILLDWRVPFTFVVPKFPMKILLPTGWSATMVKPPPTTSEVIVLVLRILFTVTEERFEPRTIEPFPVWSAPMVTVPFVAVDVILLILRES